MFDQEDGSCQCGGHAVLRLNRKTGQTFYGCSNYPSCRNTEPSVKHPAGTLLLSRGDLQRAYYDAFYDGDG